MGIFRHEGGHSKGLLQVPWLPDLRQSCPGIREPLHCRTHAALHP